MNYNDNDIDNMDEYYKYLNDSKKKQEKEIKDIFENDYMSKEYSENIRRQQVSRQNNYYQPSNSINYNNIQNPVNQNYVSQQQNINPQQLSNVNPQQINNLQPNNIQTPINNVPNTSIQPQQVVQPEKKDNTTFSVLDKYGENITKKTYITNPAIARDDEINKLILVLLTPDKSACLVGKPGIGKTAIVEGLAYRIMNNNVPNILKGYTIVNIATSSLLGESVSDGERDSRIQLLVQEVMNVDKVILFIDEIHTLMGAGAKDGSSLDFANILKPALARGNVKLIGATTSDEYERYMIRDRAFIRRFEKIEVAEPDIPTTIKILMGSYPRIEKQTGVKMGYTEYVREKIMTFIVEMTSEYKRVYELSSRYPDIALAVLSKAFSFAMFDNEGMVMIKHVWKAVVTCNSIYPDSKAKEMERFKTIFADLIKEENLNVNDTINY